MTNKLKFSPNKEMSFLMEKVVEGEMVFSACGLSYLYYAWISSRAHSSFAQIRLWYDLITVICAVVISDWTISLYFSLGQTLKKV